MKNILYLECYSGISGDMTVAALLDLGADEAVLRKVLKSIPVTGFKTKISRVKKEGLAACDFEVVLDKVHENHDHDMEYLYGKRLQESGHQSQKEHRHPVHQAHEHRGLKEVLHIIEQSEATDRAKETAAKIFRILAEAEAKAHGTSVEEVHFHEVGAVDSIVDVLAAAVCLDNLDVEQVIVSELYEGQGSIRCQHGMIPVPVPAVVNIVQEYGITLHPTSIQGELVTPTGAAIAAATATRRKLPECFRIRKIGLGAGKRKYDRTGILRAMLIEEEAADRQRENVVVDEIYKLETNIDDCPGEQLGLVMELLLEAGVKDVYYTPVYMKKNRPAYQLNVICTKDMISKAEEVIFSGTTTIGIRKTRMERTILERKQKKVQTRFGEAEVKICTLPNGEVCCYPEYRSVAEFVKKCGVNYQEAYREIQKAAIIK